MKICIVIANYYPDISKALFKGATNVLKYHKIKNYKNIIAPGIFELPTIISRNISSYDAFIALGCVIKGKTPHFDFISRASIEGIMQLSINHKKPIGNGIITCFNKNQAMSRLDKGKEAAKAVLKVLELKSTS